MFVNWLDVDKLKSRLELILMEHETLMRSTLTYNATYVLEDCTLEAKFQHKYHNDSDRDRELSLVIKMYYFNIRHTMIVTIFYSFVSFNILTKNSSRITKERWSLCTTQIRSCLFITSRVYNIKKVKLSLHTILNNYIQAFILI